MKIHKRFKNSIKDGNPDEAIRDVIFELMTAYLIFLSDIQCNIEYEKDSKHETPGKKKAAPDLKVYLQNFELKTFNVEVKRIRSTLSHFTKLTSEIKQEIEKMPLTSGVGYVFDIAESEKIKRLFWYKLTEQALLALKQDEHFPEDVIIKLDSLKNKEYSTDDQVISDLKQILGKQQTQSYKSLILKYADPFNSLVTGIVQYIKNIISQEISKLTYDEPQTYPIFFKDGKIHGLEHDYKLRMLKDRLNLDVHNLGAYFYLQLIKLPSGLPENRAYPLLEAIVLPYTQEEYVKFQDVICLKLKQMLPGEINVLFIINDSLTHDEIDLDRAINEIQLKLTQRDEDFFRSKRKNREEKFESVEDFLYYWGNLSGILLMNASDKKLYFKQLWGNLHTNPEQQIPPNLQDWLKRLSI